MKIQQNINKKRFARVWRQYSGKIMKQSLTADENIETFCGDYYFT